MFLFNIDIWQNCDRRGVTIVEMESNCKWTYRNLFYHNSSVGICSSDTSHVSLHLTFV